MKVLNVIVGLALFVLALAVANAVPSIFNTYTTATQDLIRAGFQIIALIGLLAGLLK